MFKSAVELKIGNDYREWKGATGEKYGDRIFIDAPTGSGKTTFILKTLLPYYSAQKKRILYLVNRRILKEQILEMVASLPHKQFASIKVELYQEIEKRVVVSSIQYDEEDSRQGYDYSLLEKLSDYDCVVCDESHYFLTDSTYNTNTVFSFRWIQETFLTKVCIFMSATISEVKSYIEKNNIYEYGKINTAYYEIGKYTPSVKWIIDKMIMARGEECRELEKRHNIRTYSIARNYSFIEAENIRIIENRKDLVDMVAEGNHKWLIFVDSINYGKALRESVIKKMSELEGKDTESIKHKVRLLTSGYKRDQNDTDEVDRIIRTQAPSAKVLIATAVLDNGVNIKDIDVRNVVLFADSETEFIQMLGRKRKDAQQFKLYIYGYDKNHFSKRKRQIMEQKKIADHYLRDIEEKIDKLEIRGYSNLYEDEDNIRRLNDWEKKCIEYLHKKMIHEMFGGYIRYEDVRRLFTVYNGKLHLNRLSFQNIEYLNSYFQDMIEKFEADGEDAFAREELRWLGKTGEVAEEIIMRSKQTREEEGRIRVKALLTKIAGKKMLSNEFIEITNGIIEDLRVLVAHPVDFPKAMTRTNEEFESWDKIKREFKKTGKVISKQSMNFLCAYCRIPFRVENDRKGGYVVQHVDVNEDNTCNDNKK